MKIHRKSPRLFLSGVMSILGAACVIESGSAQPPPATCPCPLPAGLVGWWRGEGDATDAAAGHTGFFPGAAYALGEVGQAFSFDGSNYVGLSNLAAYDFTTQCTIEGWINPSDVSTCQQIFTKWSYAPGDYAYELDNRELSASEIQMSRRMMQTGRRIPPGLSCT